MASKKAQKEAAYAAFLERVKSALADAHAAAKAAFQKFDAEADHDNSGQIIDACGGATLRAYKPSYRFRKALKELGEIEHYGSHWSISNFHTNVPSQSVTASERAYEAACAVFRERFPEDGEFFMNSYMS
jgi:hypothetical protein